MTPHHTVEGVACGQLVRLLQDALQQERVLGESLVRLRHHVGQLQPIALLVRLPPLRRETQHVTIWKCQKNGRACWED